MRCWQQGPTGADRWAGQLIAVFCDGTVGAVDEGTTNA